MPACGRVEARPETTQQRVAGRVAEGVVVGLEPVEIEQGEDRGLACDSPSDGRAPSRSWNSCRRLLSPVRWSLVVSARSAPTRPLVLARADQESRGDRRDRRASQPDRPLMDLVEMVGDQDEHRRRRRDPPGPAPTIRIRWWIARAAKAETAALVPISSAPAGQRKSTISALAPCRHRSPPGTDRRRPRPSRPTSPAAIRTRASKRRWPPTTSAAQMNARRITSPTG